MNIKWIPIDADNLYAKEVLAINTSHDILVGYLYNEEGIIGCEDDSTQLHEVTHYIPTTELVKLLKLQTSGLEDVSLG